MHFGKLVKYIVKTEACTSAAIWRFCGLFAELSRRLAAINPLAYLEIAHFEDEASNQLLATLEEWNTDGAEERAYLEELAESMTLGVYR